MALYNKYRPANLDQVCGQEHVKRILRSQVSKNDLVHAYLFTGPAGTGKTTVARILAAMLNCSTGQTVNPPADDKFVSLILSGKSPYDVVEMDAAANRSIDDVRELRRNAYFTPSEMRRKIYIIDECHRLTPEAWEALLKILEEPPPHLVFILCTTEPEKILETIQTRCMCFDFRALAPKDIAVFIKNIVQAEGIKADDAVVRALALAAKGSLRMAISYLDKVKHLQDDNGGQVSLEDLSAAIGMTPRSCARDFVNAAVQGQYANALAASSKLISSGVEPGNFMSEVAVYLHDVVMLGITGFDMAAYGYTAEETNDVRETQELFKSVGDFRRLAPFCVEALDGACKLAVFNVQPQYQVDSAYVSIRNILRQKRKEAAG